MSTDIEDFDIPEREQSACSKKYRLGVGDNRRLAKVPFTAITVGEFAAAIAKRYHTIYSLRSALQLFFKG
jgi:hypothetical protein